MGERGIEGARERAADVAHLELVHAGEVDDDLIRDDEQRREVLEREDQLFLALHEKPEELLAVHDNVDTDYDRERHRSRAVGASLVAVNTPHCERISVVAADAPAAQRSGVP